jgi:hypothetical protein
MSSLFVSSSSSGEPTALNFLVSFTNNGNTPTKNLQLLTRCALSTDELQEPWSDIHRGPTPYGKDVPVFIGAHASQTSGCSFPWEQVVQIRDGKLFGYLLSDANYFDRLDQSVSRKTQMALHLAHIEIQPKTNPAMPPVVIPLLWAIGKHNCADEECPAD